MIDQVTFEKSTYAGLPHKFEAGTPNICGGIGFGVAIDYLNTIGCRNINKYEKLVYAVRGGLQEIRDLKVLLMERLLKKPRVISFNVGEIHPYDIGYDC